jgi:hypothetical protein
MPEKDLMDTETRNEPATVQEGREPPAGSRGETGQKEGIDLSPAVPIEAEKQIGAKWECMSCGSVYDDPVNKCPNCGGHIRKAGLQARPVYDDNLHGPRHEGGAPSPGTDTIQGAEQGSREGIQPTDSATIEDLTARGESRDPIPQPMDPDQKERTPLGGPHPLSAEKVHDADKGSPGGGGGVGSD